MILPEDGQHIMTDLETLGIESNAAIISIGAVRFDRDNLYEEFYCSINTQSSLDAGLSTSKSTLDWWKQQSTEAKEMLDYKQVSLEEGLMSFTDFINQEDSQAYIWGNGAAFDNVILSNAYKAMSLGVPWNFWNDLCFRTIRAVHPKIQIDYPTIKHFALDDAKWQAKYFIELLKGGF